MIARWGPLRWLFNGQVTQASKSMRDHVSLRQMLRKLSSIVKDFNSIRVAQSSLPAPPKAMPFSRGNVLMILEETRCSIPMWSRIITRPA